MQLHNDPERKIMTGSRRHDAQDETMEGGDYEGGEGRGPCVIPLPSFKLQETALVSRESM